MPWHGIHELIVRAKAGDTDAWQSLHDMVCPYLISQAQRVLGPAWPQQSVSDLTQETWQRVWTKIESFRGGEDDDQTAALFRAWLCQTMTRIDSNRKRAERAQRRKLPPGTFSLDAARPDHSADGRVGFEPIADLSSVSAKLRREEDQARIEHVLSKLDDPADRELLQLCFFEKRSIRQIAKDRGVSPHTIGSRLKSILERLAQDLRDPR
jgi:RNA polymerase sigma factor (sigma-70 family)